MLQSVVQAGLRSVRLRSIPVSLALAAATLQVPAVHAVVAPGSGVDATAAGTASVQTLLHARTTPGLQHLPTNGTAALATAIDAVGADLGVPTHAARAVAAAHLPQAISARVAVLLQDLHACDLITIPAMQRLRAEAAAAPGTEPALPAATTQAIQLCAHSAYADGLAMKDFLHAGMASAPNGNLRSGSLDVWPVVHLDMENTDDTYRYDDVLIVDSGGRNTYLNNAGGNAIDVLRSPSNSAGARGCETVGEILLTTNPQCVVASAMVIQMSGDTQFEQFQTADADKVDGNGQPCATAEWYAVRRIVTEGAGVAGVGILINDSTGWGRYLGKAVSQGVGHIGGTGILDIEGGRNVIEAIRNSQGFGFLGGTGLLELRNSRNLVTWYAPAGGVVSDNGACDTTPRHLQGSGELGGVGALVARDSRGIYISNTTRAQGTGDVTPGVITGPGVGIFDSRGSSNDEFYGVPGRARDVRLVGPHSDLSGIDAFNDQATDNGPGGLFAPPGGGHSSANSGTRF